MNKRKVDYFVGEGLTDRKARFLELAENIRRDVPALIELKREGAYWDFKKQWHKDNFELLHDIICLANNLESEVSYLIIGVDEDADYEVCDVVNNPEVKRRTNQSLVDLLNSHSWAGPQPPFTTIIPFECGDATIDVVVIVSHREDMPYYLSKPDSKLKAWMVHTRRSDQNTPIDKGASWSEVEQIWRHHFALDASPLDQAIIMLRDKASWVFLTSISNLEDKYYKYAPEYTVCHRPDYERDGYEYYMLNQTDCSPSWYSISLRYHQTTLYDTLGIALDGGRYFAPVPSRSFIRWARESYKPDADVSYCYYALDSIDWVLNEFFFNEEYADARLARDRFLEMIVLFESEDERSDFEHYLKQSKDEFVKRYSDQDAPYGPERLPETYAERGRVMLGSQMRAIPAIKSMLEDYRRGKSFSVGIVTSREW